MNRACAMPIDLHQQRPNALQVIMMLRDQRWHHSRQTTCADFILCCTRFAVPGLL